MSEAPPPIDYATPSPRRRTLRGPVILTLANGVTLNGSMGEPAPPEWLQLDVAAGGLTLNSQVRFDGYVVAPAGTVTINDTAVLNGGIVADRLTVNGTGTLLEVRN